MKDKRVCRIVCGEICSGKDTLANSLIEFGYTQIDFGTLVREKYNTEERVFNNNLEPYFRQRIEELLKDKSIKKFVFTGIRQVYLAKMLEEMFEFPQFDWILVPRKVLKERYVRRDSVKDKKLSFEEAIEGDNSLGMKELIHYLVTEKKCNFRKNY